jgi:hypothetical protein
MYKIIRSLEVVEMRFRDTFVLALLGWYLILSPIITDANGRMRANPTAPLSRWSAEGTLAIPLSGAASLKRRTSTPSTDGRFQKEHWQAWEDRNSCEYRRAFLLRAYNSLWQSDAAPTAEQITDSECISTDDPRLNETE